jgi:hypothetical protein
MEGLCGSKGYLNDERKNLTLLCNVCRTTTGEPQSTAEAKGWDSNLSGLDMHYRRLKTCATTVD